MLIATTNDLPGYRIEEVYLARERAVVLPRAGRGEGHWKRRNLPASTECGPVETRATDLLNSAFSFRCSESMT
jgi:hypothetical protein